MSASSDPSHITSHPFRPPSKEQWWARCEDCGLSEAAHAASLVRCTVLTPPFVVVGVTSPRNLHVELACDCGSFDHTPGRCPNRLFA